MARHRSVDIVEDLAPSERQHRGRAGQIRIRALRLLQDDPSRTHREVAEMLGLSKPTIDRWVGIYRRQGLEGLLEKGKRKTAPPGEGRPPRQARATSRPDGVLPDSEALLGLMNSLPLSLDVAESIAVLRRELIALLPDVDRLVISVDTACDLIRPEAYRPNLDIVQDVTATGDSRRRVVVKQLDEQTSSAAVLLEFFRSQGYPVDDYHPPDSFELLYRDRAPLGTLLLWREISKPPISQGTLALVRRLLPFLNYVVSNMVARHHYISPGDRIFRNALEQMANECRLTPQERRAITYRLYGHSYKAIADELGVSEDTVNKHLRAVHRKTKTAGHAELFAKYFSPLIVPSASQGRG